jgi:hypothetical protein
MKKLILTDCKICGKTKNARGFAFHISQTHKISIEDYILKYEFNNIRPTCKCGCGAPVTIRSYQIMDYVDGHCDAGHFKIGVDRIENNRVYLTPATARSKIDCFYIVFAERKDTDKLIVES